MNTTKNIQEKSPQIMHSQSWNKDLPSPPLPSLEETMKKYLEACTTMLSSNQLDSIRQIVQQFITKDGLILQKKLEEYKNSTDNWVTDIWCDDMYLKNALCLPINSSPFIIFPQTSLISCIQYIDYAARCILFLYKINLQLESEDLSQDLNRHNQPLCMVTYKHFFNSVRLPGKEKDVLVIKPNTSNHIIVAAKNQFYALYLDDNETLESIFNALWWIWKSSDKGKYKEIGILSSDNRKEWALNREYLLKDELNSNSLKIMETCLFVVCLDDLDSETDENMTISMKAKHILCSFNRYFDIFLQLIISRNSCGIIFEHTPSEAVTLLRIVNMLLDHLNKSSTNSSILSSLSSKLSSTSLDSLESYQDLNYNIKVNKLQWNIDDYIINAINKAKKKLIRLNDSIDIYHFIFTLFGSSFIKSVLLSPDAFVQISLQYTYYKCHSRLVSSYESCSLRCFKRGRVDNIRSNTKETFDWIQAMEDKLSNRKKRLELFMKAMDTQIKITKETSCGLGPDNHLIALKHFALESKESLPALFTDNSFSDYFTFRLSTSNIPPSECVLGYGPVVNNGYGVAYMIHSEKITAIISSFNNQNKGSSYFANTFSNVLYTVYNLLSNNDGDN